MLLVTNMYPPHHLGGYELSCRDVVELFRSRGHDVTVLTTTFRHPDVDEGTEPGVIRELDFYWRDYGHCVPRGRDIVMIERRDSRILRRTVKDTRPDVLSLWNMGALPLSLIESAVEAGVPIVHHTCNDWPALNLQLDPLRTLLKRRPLLARSVCRILGVPTKLPDVGRSGAFAWVSAATWAAAERSTPWQFPASTVVHSGISHVDFPPMAPPARPRPWRGRLLFVGRLDGLKGVESVIDALALLDGCEVELIGPGDPRYLRTLMRRADDIGVGARVRALSVSRHALREHYMTADALLFTSTEEPFGLVPIEAMACATPVVASGAGGSGEFLVHETNCLLYEPGSSDALAHAVRRLAGDPSLRLSLVRNGLGTAREFSVERLADRLEAIHLEAVREHEAPAARGA